MELYANEVHLNNSGCQDLNTTTPVPAALIESIWQVASGRAEAALEAARELPVTNTVVNGLVGLVVPGITSV